jgi:hypothetical protein
MTIEAHRHGELGPRQESIAITPDSLWEDNHSQIAEYRREEFNELRRKGELFGVERCSDARVRPPSRTVSIGSISAADIPHLNLSRSQGIKAWMSLTHFSGEEVEAGKMPGGCGGLKAKKDMGSGPSEKDEGVESYIAKKIKHPDPFVQSILTASAMARASGKPALAATQDHLTGTIYPIALFEVKDGMIHNRKPLPLSDENLLNYNESLIYEEGLPVLDEGKLSEEFIELLDRNRKEQQEVLMRYPNLREMLRVQKPRTLMDTTEKRSARDRYPLLSSIPGAIFKVHRARNKIGGLQTVGVSDVLNSLNQLEYPATNAVENYEDSNKPFSNTDRLIIETGEIELSIELAKKALEKKWMQNWLELPDRRIIVAQSSGGVLSLIDWFQP